MSSLLHINLSLRPETRRPRPGIGSAQHQCRGKRRKSRRCCLHSVLCGFRPDAFVPNWATSPVFLDANRSGVVAIRSSAYPNGPGGVAIVSRGGAIRVFVRAFDLRPLAHAFPVLDQRFLSFSSPSAAVPSHPGSRPTRHALSLSVHASTSCGRRAGWSSGGHVRTRRGDRLPCGLASSRSPETPPCCWKARA
jgi:hypothetical protein